MKSAALVLFALLFASAPLAAQTASQQPSQTTVLRLPPNIGCPVSLRAQHRAASQALLQIQKYLPGGVGQLLHITLINSDSRQIVAANVRVHGLSGNARITQTMSDPKDAERTQFDQLTFSSGAGQQVSSDLWAYGMTAVLSIDLDSVTFADGSTRIFSPPAACRVTPDPKMLIANR